MKKIGIIILAATVSLIACVLGFVACGSKSESTSTAKGTYYYCENNEIDAQLYITFKDGVWTDDDGLTGEYTIAGGSSNSSFSIDDGITWGREIKLYIVISGEKVLFARGIIVDNNKDIMLKLNNGGDRVVYRKGEDIDKVKREKTLQFELSDDKTYYTVIGIGGLMGDIVVPEQYKRKPVRAIAENAFANNSNVTTLTVGNSVQSIGKKAFYKCKNLAEIVVGDSVREIDESVFEGCATLTKITISSSVTKINVSAFTECKLLEYIYYTGNISEWVNIDYVYMSGDIGNILHTSSGCRKLYINGELVTEAEIGAKEIKSCAFYMYKYLTSVSLTDNVLQLGDYAFAGCSELAEVNLGNGVKTIGKRAFYDCQKIGDIVLPQSVTKIDAGAFSHCLNITSLDTGGCVRYIGKEAFSSCEKLSEVELGNSLVEIGSGAFYNCTLLNSVTIPETVIFIGRDAFSFSGLTNATFVKSTDWIANNTVPLSSEQLSDPANAAELLLTSFLHNGYADVDWEQPTLEYTLSRDKSYYIVNNIGTACLSKIEIPEEYNEKPVRALADNAFKDCENLTEILLPSCLMNVGKNAFDGCTRLKYIDMRGALTTQYDRYYSAADGILFNGDYTRVVYIPQGMTEIKLTMHTINAGLFKDNTDIEKVIIGTSVKSIGSAFAGCSSLTSITFAENSQLTGIESSAFAGCSKLASIEIPNSVTSIGSYAFNDCSSLTNVTIPNSVTSIGEYAFQYCSSLTSITIPNSVTSIGWFAFQYCSSLTSITIPNSVRSIGNNAFEDCSSLTIYCEAASKPNGWNSNWNDSYCPVVWDCKNNDKDKDGYAYYVIDGIRYSLKDGVGTVIEQPSNISGSIIIPSSMTYKNEIYRVTSIGSSAFRNCSNLTSITIPRSVTSIGSGAFKDCSSLTSITYTGDIKSWCEISGLENIMPGGTNITLTIGGKEIKGDLVIPNSVTYIGQYAFRGSSSSLTSVTVPNSVTSIGEHAFGDSRSLTIYCEAASAPSGWNSNWKYSRCPVVWDCKNNDKDKDGYAYTVIDGIRYSLKDEEATVVVQPTNVQGGIIIPSNVTYKNETYSVTSIGDDAFQNCGSITSIQIPNSVTIIASFAFRDCSNLTSVNIPENVEYIGDYAFQYCTSLANVTIHENCRAQIGPGAFGGCISLTNIVIPKNVTHISTAFYNCSSLTSIELPAGITSLSHSSFIGDGVLGNCVNLTTIIYGGTKEQWEQISKSEYWNENTGNYIIICTDGKLAKDGTVIE